MAQVQEDHDNWAAIIVPTPNDLSEKGQWGVILNTMTLQRLGDRTYYALRRLEELSGGGVTNVQILGTRALADVSNSLPSEGWVLRYREGRYVPEQLPEGGITVLENGSQVKPQSLTTQEREVGDIANYETLANCTLASVATPTSVGANSLRVRAVAAGNMSAMIVRKIPVVEGALWRASLQTRANTLPRESRVGLRWLNDSDTLISTTWGNSGFNSSSTWTEFTLEDVAPVGAVSAQVVFDILATGTANEDHFADNFSLTQALTSRSNLNITGIPVTDSPELDAISLDFETFVNDVMTTLNDAVQDVQDLADQLEADVSNAISDINDRADQIEASVKREAFKAAILFGRR